MSVAPANSAIPGVGESGEVVKVEETETSANVVVLYRDRLSNEILNTSVMAALAVR